MSLDLSRSMFRQLRQRSVGFSLIELMIVVAIIGILAAVAYPSYAEHVRKSRRAQAKADLVEYSQLLERSHTTNNTYTSFTFGNGLKTIQSPREGGIAQYNITLAATQSSFPLTAAPQGNQAKDQCGTLTLNQAGVKTPGATTIPGCW